jgi:F-type H+-transporting ATPase subunit b
VKHLKSLVCITFASVILLAGLRHASAQAAPAVNAPPASGASAAKPASPTTDVEFDESKQYRESPSVQKMGSMLGLKPEQAATVFEVTNFAVLAILIGLFLLKALPKAFRARGSAIQKDLVDARTATEQASVRLSGVEARLAKLDGEIAAMRAQADKDSAFDEQRIKASLEEETKKILAAAEQEIAAATVHARRDIQKFAAELAIEQAARKLVISAETDRLLVQNFARRLGGDVSKEGQN